MLIYRLI